MDGRGFADPDNSAHKQVADQVHGGRDQLVPPAQAQVLTTRLSQVGAPHRLVLIPHANHGFEFIWSGWGSQMTRLAVSDFLRPFR